MKAKISNAMAVFSKSMVQPLIYVSVIGIVMLLGILLTNQALTGILPFLGWAPLKFIGNLIYTCLMFLINNLSVLFCVGIAGAMAKKNRQHAGLIALMSYFIFLNSNNLTLVQFNKLAEMSMFGLIGTGQSTVLGIQVQDMGVFSGMLMGVITGVVFNKHSEKQIKGVWQMFSGTRFPFLLMIFISMGLGFGMTFVWPYVQAVITGLTGVIANTGNFGLFLYSMLNKWLIPTGMHHLVYAPFMFSSVGGTMEAGGQLIQGAYAVRTAEVAAGLPLSDSSYWMSFTFINIFGYIGAALAFVKTAYPQNREKVKAMLIPLTIGVVISSITEPFDFLFCFAAPALWLVFSCIGGIANVMLKVLSVPSLTSGGLINVLLGNIIAGTSRTRWPIMLLLAVVFAAITYFVFVFLITKFNMKTPGRDNSAAEDNTVSEKPVESVSKDALGATIVKALGGKENVESVDCCFTRLRVSLKDPNLMDETLLKTTGSSGVIKKGDDIQIIYGVKVGEVKDKVETELNR